MRPSSQVLSSKPLISVIIPAWNEEVGISKTIRSVINSTYHNLELIVVNDGSTDGTQKITRKTILEYPKRIQDRIKLIEQTNQGKAEALNTGVAAAKGELILTLDADSYLEPSSISLLEDALKNPDYGVAIGEVIVGNTKHLLGMAQHYEYLIGFHFKRSQHVTNSSYIFPGALTMFRSDVLRSAGKFSGYSSTEDLDISMKIKANGVRVAYIDKAVCITEGAGSVRGLISQRTRWRHGFIKCLLTRRDFTNSVKKGKYLSFVELPINILSMFEILLLPIIIGFIVLSLIVSSPLVAILSYALLPAVILLLSEVRDHKNPPPQIRAYYAHISTPDSNYRIHITS